MEYILKDKIAVTKEFLSDLESKSWQEIERLQSQISNIEDAELLKLLNNLLTSYYVFTGGLENLIDTKVIQKNTEPANKICAKEEPMQANSLELETRTELRGNDNLFEPRHVKDVEQKDIKPFEYFVDFDEPTGDPISDEDLYGNN